MTLEDERIQRGTKRDAGLEAGKDQSPIMNKYSRPKLLRIEELGEYLNIPVGTIYYWVHLRKIPFIKMGRGLRFDLLEVLRHFNDATEEFKDPCLGLRDKLKRKKSSSLTTRDADHAGLRRKE